MVPRRALCCTANQAVALKTYPMPKIQIRCPEYQSVAQKTYPTPRIPILNKIFTMQYDENNTRRRHHRIYFFVPYNVLSERISDIVISNE